MQEHLGLEVSIRIQEGDHLKDAIVDHVCYVSLQRMPTPNVVSQSCPNTVIDFQIDLGRVRCVCNELF